MSELGNPVGTFISEALIIDPLSTASKDDVFACYKHWSLKKSIPPGTELAFKRRFLAAIQEHRVESVLIRSNGERIHAYSGIRLNEKAQAYVDSIETFNDAIF